jgi:PAS domain S-box-containing protein
MSLTMAGYALTGLTIVMVAIFAALIVSLMRASSARRRLRESGAETAWMSAALQEAVTKLKAQERQTAARADASERFASQIIAGLASGLIVVNRDGRVQTVNPAARRMLNIPADALSKPIQDVLPATPLTDVIGETLHSGRPIVRRTVPVEQESRTRHYGVTVSPMHAADGGLQAAVCLFTDLTEVVDLEQQLRFKEALAQLGELTAGLAHEFRNGLSTIHGYARLLDPAVIPEAQRPCVEGIRSETAALGAVVTNFLNFAKPERLSLAPVDLRAVVRRAADDIDPGVGRIDISGEFGIVDGDEVLLRQAFSNLIRNGVEAATQAGRAPDVRVTGTVDEETTRVQVDDNGPGIPSDQAGQIFRPFFSTKAGGTGLGLAIVQKVIVSHNGRVTLAASQLGGAQFRVQLPRSTRR